MAFDEGNYETMKILKCRKCGNIFAASLTGSQECPECESSNVLRYRPDGKEDSDDGPLSDKA